MKILIYKLCILLVYGVKLYYNAKCKKKNKNKTKLTSYNFLNFSVFTINM